MLGRDGTVTGNRVAPVAFIERRAGQLTESNREWIYSQQQTVSAEGSSGQTFNTHVPHTVRATETKGCTDCHVQRRTTTTPDGAVALAGHELWNFHGTLRLRRFGRGARSRRGH